MAQHRGSPAVVPPLAQDATDDVSLALAWFDTLPAERRAAYDSISRDERMKFEKYVQAGGDPSRYDPST